MKIIPLTVATFWGQDKVSESVNLLCVTLDVYYMNVIEVYINYRE